MGLHFHPFLPNLRLNFLPVAHLVEFQAHLADMSLYYSWQHVHDSASRNVFILTHRSSPQNKPGGPYTKFYINHINPLCKILAFSSKKMLTLQVTHPESCLPFPERGRWRLERGFCPLRGLSEFGGFSMCGIQQVLAMIGQVGQILDKSWRPSMSEEVRQC